MTIERGYTKFAPGSVLLAMGDTRVLCTAMIEKAVPPFLEETGSGWLTAEYAMLPASTPTRKRRGPDGRATEIRRLIGRSLRAAVDLDAIGPRTIHIDCDVLQADGGTRTAAISGAYVALADAVRWMQRKGLIRKLPRLLPVAAVSVGMVDGRAVLDLPYCEDHRAEVDLNVVMTRDGRFIEVQGTAEREPFDAQQLDALLNLARRGVRKIIRIQSQSLRAEL